MPTAAQREQLSRYLGPLEMRIMADVWKSGPSTVNDVLKRLNRGRRKSLAYNTVMSTLSRLSEKGFLTRERSGRAFVYSGEGPEAFLQAQAARATRELIDDLGSLGVAGVVEGLEADEESRKLIRELIARAE